MSKEINAILVELQDLITTLQVKEKALKAASQALDAQYASALPHIENSTNQPDGATQINRSIKGHFLKPYTQLGQEQKQELATDIQAINTLLTTLKDTLLTAQKNTTSDESTTTLSAQICFDFGLFTDKCMANLRKFMTTEPASDTYIFELLDKTGLDNAIMVGIASGYITRKYDTHQYFNPQQPLENFIIDRSCVKTLEARLHVLRRLASQASLERALQPCIDRALQAPQSSLSNASSPVLGTVTNTINTVSKFLGFGSATTAPVADPGTSSLPSAENDVNSKLSKLDAVAGEFSMLKVTEEIEETGTGTNPPNGAAYTLAKTQANNDSKTETANPSEKVQKKNAASKKP